MGAARRNDDRALLMRKALVALLIVPGLAAAPAALASSDYVVVVHAQADPALVARAHGLRPEHVYRHALRGYAAPIPDDRLPALRADPRVTNVVRDTTFGPAAKQPAQVLPTGVDGTDFDISSTRAGDGSGSVGVPIGVLDTGIEPDHPDLNVAGGVDCIGDKRGFDDANGHGTYVAGIAGARDNGIGVVGAAPDAPVYSVRVLDGKGRGSMATIICGIDWVAGNAASLGLKVANMSLAGPRDAGEPVGACQPGSADVLHLAICGMVAAGVTPVAAAGNDGVDLAGQVPASYPEVIAATAMWDSDGRPGGLGVGATPFGGKKFCGMVDDVVPNFSNYTLVGSPNAAHTLAAPGVCIYSTALHGGYAIDSGTSAAAPEIAGAAALCIGSGRCSGDPAGVMATLRQDAAALPASYGFDGDPNDPITADGQTRYYGYLLYAGRY